MEGPGLTPKGADQRRQRAWRRHADRYGAASTYEGWRLVHQRYLADQLAEALDLAQSLGAGQAALGLSLYRLVEAEALTRQLAHRESVRPWLMLETIHEELTVTPDELTRWVLSACDEVAAKLQWTHGPPVLFTLFAEAANTPWTPDRHGFCVDKVPYTKICLPWYLQSQPEEFAEAVRHEYTHVVMLHLGQGRVPRWLDEAAAMTLGGQLEEAALRRFIRHRESWLDPDELDDAYYEDREDREGARVVSAAYQQSAWLGRWLAQRYDVAGFGELARRCAPAGFLSELRLRIAGQDPADRALRQTLRRSMTQVFGDARDALVNRNVPDGS